MGDLIKGKKAVKDLCAAIGKTQRDIAAMYDTNDSIVSNRVKRGYYDNPGNFARLVDDLGYKLNFDIKIGVYDHEGNFVSDVAVNTDYLMED